MFIEQTLKRNPELIRTAFDLHQKGRIPPDSYLIDVDAFLENADKILNEAQKYRIRLYFMLKQVGRNPYLAGKLIELGYPGAVVVDFKEAALMMDHHIPIGNVGHLVQVPQSMLDRVVSYGPEVMTVYSLAKLDAIEQAVAKLGKQQAVLLRVCDESDLIYSGQTAGFLLGQLETVVSHVNASCPHLTVKGVTSFPCYLYCAEADDICPTNNLGTVQRAKKILEQLGCRDLLVNTPSATCVRTIQKMALDGANCGEPGHGLTGTTPMHAYRDLPELPAVVYVSEISHNFQGKAYCYGGGYYRRSNVEEALVGKAAATAKRLAVIPPCSDSIDYHFGLSEECPVGDTVVMAFRFQIFVTRSDVVLVEGIHRGRPRITGIYDSLGRKKEQLD